MEQITVKIPDDIAESLSNVADDEHDGNRSKAIRSLLRRGMAAGDLERENERLRNEKRALVNQREEHGELVEYAAREKAVAERREERRDAPAWRRAKWWLLGRD